MGWQRSLHTFSGRSQLGCFWATFRTPTHLFFIKNIIFMFRTVKKTIFRPPGDVSQAARILGKLHQFFARPFFLPPPPFANPPFATPLTSFI